MRSRFSGPTALLLFLLTIFLLSAATRAAEDTYDDDEYEERARVLRVSLLKGEVSLKRAGNDEWEDARLNMPLVEGDVLATGRDSRLEIQADARNFVRVGPDSVLRVVTLRDEGIALSLSEGTATFRLARFDKDKEYFELDAPGTTVAAERTGQYRVDVERGGAVRITVREDGRARIYSQNSGFVLRNNRTARLASDGSGESDWEFMAAAGFDEWDVWNDERERHLASRLRYDGRDRYYDSDVYGAEELDAYGEWVYTKDYGYIWRPHATAVNVYNDWAPYRYGRWVWCPPYGWTWVADEPWGWAPYHYGRWVYYNNNWCWAPRGYGYRYRRAWWRPALVVFVTLDFGRDRHVCWYPLTYGQRDPRGRHWSRGYDRLSPLRGRDLEHLRRSNPHLLRAVSTVPAREFGDRTLRARPAAGDLAGRALAGEPVRGQLPIERAGSMRGAPRVGPGAGRERTTGAEGRDTLTINRPTPVMPPRAIADRRSTASCAARASSTTASRACLRRLSEQAATARRAPSAAETRAPAPSNARAPTALRPPTPAATPHGPRACGPRAPTFPPKPRPATRPATTPFRPSGARVTTTAAERPAGPASDRLARLTRLRPKRRAKSARATTAQAPSPARATSRAYDHVTKKEAAAPLPLRAARNLRRAARRRPLTAPSVQRRASRPPRDASRPSPGKNRLDTNSRDRSLRATTLRRDRRRRVKKHLVRKRHVTTRLPVRKLLVRKLRAKRHRVRRLHASATPKRRARAQGPISVNPRVGGARRGLAPPLGGGRAPCGHDRRNSPHDVTPPQI